MARGGYQKPPAKVGPSGPGKFSKRTDGQDIRVPNVSDSPDLQYGDRTMLENAQRAVPIPKGGQPPARPAGAPLAPGPLPAHITQGPSNRPGEPVTTGLPMGPGAGPEALTAPPNVPDQREQVLMYLMQNFGNDSAAKMLAGIRSERSAPSTPAPGAPPTGPPPPPPTSGPAGPTMGPPPQQGPPVG